MFLEAFLAYFDLFLLLITFLKKLQHKNMFRGLLIDIYCQSLMMSSLMLKNITWWCCQRSCYHSNCWYYGEVLSCKISSQKLLLFRRYCVGSSRPPASCKVLKNPVPDMVKDLVMGSIFTLTCPTLLVGYFEINVLISNL